MCLNEHKEDVKQYRPDVIQYGPDVIQYGPIKLNTWTYKSFSQQLVYLMRTFHQVLFFPITLLVPDPRRTKAIAPDLPPKV